MGGRGNLVREPFGWIRRTGIAVTLLAWLLFLASFRLTAATPIGSSPGLVVPLQSGWQTFVESVTNCLEAAGNPMMAVYGMSYFRPLVLLCLLSPVLNAMMLLAPLVNLKLKHSAAVFGAILLFSGLVAIWVCWQSYERLAAGFGLWIGSILATAVASLAVGASWFMRDNIEHDRLLAELMKSVPPQPDSSSREK